MDTLPNFLLIGASKTGTTSVYHYLKQHPDVFLPDLKEPGFFAFEGDPEQSLEPFHPPFVTELPEYEALFEGVAGELAVGECSPQYLDHATPEIVERIRELLPEVRLIAILRQPVERAFSSYLMHVREGFEPARSFEQAIETERTSGPAPGVQPYFYGAQRYSENLSLYLDAFGRNRVKVCIYDDLVADAQGFVRDLFEFLGVDPGFEPDTSRRHYAGRQFSNEAMFHLLKRPNPLRFLARRLVPDRVRIPLRERFSSLVRRRAEKLDPDLRKRLTAELEPEIAALERLTGRDLTAWR